MGLDNLRRCRSAVYNPLGASVVLACCEVAVGLHACAARRAVDNEASVVYDGK